MKKIRITITIGFLIGVTSFSQIKKSNNGINESKLLSYIVNPAKQELKFYWKNQYGENYFNFQNLKLAIEKESKELIFAMNGGMYTEYLSPLGLFIEDGITHTKTDTVRDGYGNFYLQPNGIFYLTKENKPIICTTDIFINSENIKYATQSGPMLLIDGKIHPKFREGSVNIRIRNGVGILPDGSLLFAMSKEEINFYDFASYFKQNGCKNALYLDGSISKTYLPSKNWEQTDGNFGVIIGETKKKK